MYIYIYIYIWVGIHRTAFVPKLSGKVLIPCPPVWCAADKNLPLYIWQPPGAFQVSSQRRRQQESHELRQVEAESWLGRMPLRGARAGLRASAPGVSGPWLYPTNWGQLQAPLSVAARHKGSKYHNYRLLGAMSKLCTCVQLHYQFTEQSRERHLF